MFRQQALGTVTQGSVRLRRLNPFIANSYAPCFEGSFRQDQRGVVLVGRFITPEWVKGWNALVFGFIALWSCPLVVTALVFPLRVGWFLLLVCGFAGLMVIFVRLAQWLACHDAEWLSHVIEDALAPGARPVMSPETSWLKAKFLKASGQ